MVPARDFDVRGRYLPLDRGVCTLAPCYKTLLATPGRARGSLPGREAAPTGSQSLCPLRFFQLRSRLRAIFLRGGGLPSRVSLVGGAVCRKLASSGRSARPSPPQGGPKVLPRMSENATLATLSSAAGLFPSRWTPLLAGISRGQYVLRARPVSAGWVDPRPSPGGPKLAPGPILDLAVTPAGAEPEGLPLPDPNTIRSRPSAVFWHLSRLSGSNGRGVAALSPTLGSHRTDSASNAGSPTLTVSRLAAERDTDSGFSAPAGPTSLLAF